MYNFNQKKKIDRSKLCFTLRKTEIIFLIYLFTNIVSNLDYYEEKVRGFFKCAKKDIIVKMIIVFFSLPVLIKILAILVLNKGGFRNIPRGEGVHTFQWFCGYLCLSNTMCIYFFQEFVRDVCSFILLGSTDLGTELYYNYVRM